MRKVYDEFKGLIFVALLLLLVLSFHPNANSGSHTQRLTEQSKREGWSFDFKIDRAHEKGLKKKVGLNFPQAPLSLTPIIIPDSLNLIPTLTPIEDQGQCGSCWAFSLTATLRDSYKIKYGKDMGELSQQYLVDCATNANGCSGGYFDAANFLLSPKGSPFLSSYPYTASEGSCKIVPPAESAASWHMLGGPNGPSTRDIESYLVQTKMPVSTVVAAGTGPWEYYNGGVYNACTLGNVDHMINIVGFFNEGAKFNRMGNLPPGKGIWIIRNSWGKSWGEAGYIRMKMTDTNGRRCNNIAEQVAYITP